MNTIQPTIKLNDNEIICHHMPDDHDWPTLRHGMTLRQALNELRQADWGNMGGTHPIDLSDGTYIQVELTPICGSGHLLDSQRVRRYEYDSRVGERTIRHYPIA